MDRKDFFSVLGKSLVGGAAFLTGCKDLLDQNNPNTLTPKSFWQSASDAKANVNSIYQMYLGETGWGAAAFNWYDRMVPALYRADDIGITHDVPDWWSLAMFTITENNNRSNDLWSHSYTGIFRANQAIENIPGISMDKTLKNRLVGEAKFLRAYFYFGLVKNFKNVPIILSIPQSSDQYSVTQAKPSETWAQIEKDLKDAMSVLPNSYDASNKGRITKGAAMGYLGKSYLYQEKWSDAVSVFNQIINSGNYALVPEFKDVFAVDNDFSEESLLEVNYSTGTFKGESIVTPRNREEGLSEAGGWYECYPNQWLFDQMTKEKTTSGELDPRVYYTILWNDSGMKYYGQSYDDLVGANATKTGWMKYSEAELDHTISDYSGKNMRVLRYADILLMHAEATIRNGGSLSDAKTSINKVRNRANLSDLPAAMNETEVLQEIEHQRICELADEGNRWFDLLRWGGSITGDMSIKENLVQHGAIGADNYVPDKHEYLPIPLSELQTNTKAEQNNGY